MTRTDCESYAAECVLRVLYLEGRGLWLYGSREHYSVLLKKCRDAIGFWTRMAEET